MCGGCHREWLKRLSREFINSNKIYYILYQYCLK